MRKGEAVGPHGGVFLTMRHLDPAMVRRMFKGMVERCRDVGFDLVGGLVEVVPTAHYMMGGIRFRPDCATELPGLYAAGEDTGGVHGANRLGGNGVANSTVFGGIAGDTMARDIDAGLSWREPDEAAIQEAVARAQAPLQRPASNVEAVREGLHELMWEDAGIIRDAGSLARAAEGLDRLDQQLECIGVDAANLAFNLTWHDWLNLKNLILVSRAIVAAAVARVDSRGAHFRSDYPQASDLKTSQFTCVALREGRIDVTTEPVVFTRVRPGETLIQDAAAE
jgi:fumarate reductase flavoprotein subunit